MRINIYVDRGIVMCVYVCTAPLSMYIYIYIYTPYRHVTVLFIIVLLRHEVGRSTA